MPQFPVPQPDTSNLPQISVPSWLQSALGKVVNATGLNDPATSTMMAASPAMAFAPAATAAEELAPTTLSRAGEFMNNLVRGTLLSPMSAAVKTAGDAGGLMTYGLRHPSAIPGILREAVSPDTVEAFKAGLTSPTTGMESSTGIEDLFRNPKNPLSWIGRYMSGATTATKDILERAGAGRGAGWSGSPLDTDVSRYTLTATPNGPISSHISKLLNAPIFKHIQPFSRIPLNLASRGFEFSPAGFARLSRVASREGLTPEEMKDIVGDAGLGSAAMYGGYYAGQHGAGEYLKDHPWVNRLVGAGPLGPSIEAGVTLGSKDKKPIAAAIDNFVGEYPGMRTVKDILDSKGDPTKMLANYLARYTNIAKPITDLIDPRRVQTYSDDWSTIQNLLGPTEANVPRAKANLPTKSSSPFGAKGSNPFADPNFNPFK